MTGRDSLRNGQGTFKLYRLSDVHAESARLNYKDAVVSLTPPEQERPGWKELGLH